MPLKQLKDFGPGISCSFRLVEQPVPVSLVFALRVDLFDHVPYVSERCAPSAPILPWPFRPRLAKLVVGRGDDTLVSLDSKHRRTSL
jgi:hypothetical protein